MSDFADNAAGIQQDELKRALEKHQSEKPKFIEGDAGECDNCGKHFSRVVNSLCGRCRDELGVG